MKVVKNGRRLTYEEMNEINVGFIKSKQCRLPLAYGLLLGISLHLKYPDLTDEALRIACECKELLESLQIITQGTPQEIFEANGVLLSLLHVALAQAANFLNSQFMYVSNTKKPLLIDPRNILDESIKKDLGFTRYQNFEEYVTEKQKQWRESGRSIFA